MTKQEIWRAEHPDDPATIAYNKARAKAMAEEESKDEEEEEIEANLDGASDAAQDSIQRSTETSPNTGSSFGAQLLDNKDGPVALPPHPDDSISTALNNVVGGITR